MNSPIIRFLGKVFRFALVFTMCTALVRAEGSLSFRTTPSTITAGQGFSWMELGLDWPGRTPTTTVAAFPGVNFPLPQLPVAPNIQVTTSRTTGASAALLMRFVIPDQTIHWPTGTTGGTQLRAGDTIIIQIDPNDSGHATTPSVQLSPGSTGNATTDYRFEVFLNQDFDDAPDTSIVDTSLTGFRTPSSATAWGATTLTSNLILPGQSSPWVSVTYGSSRYTVDVTIPISFLYGATPPANDQRFGIAYAVINDLTSQFVIGGATLDGLTGSPFPSSLVLDPIDNDPGVRRLGLIASDASGVWTNPSQWGTGFFSDIPGNLADVHFLHDPYWFSSSIRIGKCDTSSFGSIAQATGVNQGSLANWYEYYPGTSASEKPCQMRVWFQVQKDQPGVMRRRFLVVWATPGIAPGTWAVVALTEPIGVVNSGDTFNVLWSNVTKGSFVDQSAHPCIRIYVLPEDLGANFGSTPADVFIRGITTQSQLNDVESRYMLQGDTDLRKAQMNFTNLKSGDCPAASNCRQTAMLPRESFPNGDDQAVRFVNASFQAPKVADDEVNLVPAARATEIIPQQSVADPQNGLVRIFVEGFGFARPPAGKPYTYLTPLGGIGYVVTSADLQKRESLKLEFEVTNPRLLRRDFTTNPPREVLSPTRNVFLGVRIATTNGVPVPSYTVKLDRDQLGPGESTKGTVVIRPQGGSGAFKRWGLSLHAGVSIPHGNLNTVFNPGPNVGVDLEYRFNSMFSLEGIYTFHRFIGETFGAFTFPDLNVHQVSVNGKVYGSSSPWRPFVNFGGGVYNFNTSTTRGGLNVGGGLQFDIAPNVAVDAMYNFHNVFTSGSNTRFSTVQGGVRFRF